ncbi:hypothetical protein PINS_up001615 [Pythium insidiosum]|nr:hypothetical protein PINS_up001615 [Pythium insidiosum]
MTSADATGFEALTVEPKVLEHIVALLPMDSACHAIGDATALLQSVAAISRTLPKEYGYLARNIGPQHRAFWRDMVLRCFDFTVSPRVKFNVMDYSNYPGELYDPEESEFNDPNVSEFLRAAVKQWHAANPDEDLPRMMLIDDLAYWEHLQVFFQPQQYGFLRKIQHGELGLDAWPDHEDPFMLFCDLAFIKDKFPVFEGKMQTKSDGDQYLYPVFLSSYRNEVTGSDQAFLQHCGYTPHFWTSLERPISDTWSEFTLPKAKEEEENKALASGEKCQEDIKMGVEKEDDEDEDNEDEDFGGLVHDELPFPDATRRTLDNFQALVRRYMDDFRAVRVNFTEYWGPTFHVGRMKRSGRWLGFVGQRDW